MTKNYPKTKTALLASALCAVIVALTVMSAVLLTGCVTPISEYEVNTDNTKYGLWWYGPDGEDGEMLRASSELPLEYYDPSKPTVVYSHGWKTQGEDEPLTTVTSALISSKEDGISVDVDYAKALKDAGYNVAYFKWNAYAKQLFSMHRLIWSKNFTDSAVAAEKADLVDVSLAGEFAREFVTSMQDYEGAPVYFVGHSFGAQMVTAAAYTLYGMSAMGLLVSDAIMPQRIVLADPYIPSTGLSGELDITGESLSDKNCAQVFAQAVESMSGSGAAIDLYCGMAIAYKSYGSDEYVDGVLTEKTNYVLMDGLTQTYGSVGDIHNVTRDWVLYALTEGLGGEKLAFSPNPAQTAEQAGSAFGEYSMSGGFDLSDVSLTSR